MQKLRKEAYINYRVLKKYISIFKVFEQNQVKEKYIDKSKLNTNGFEIVNFDEQINNKLKFYQMKFEQRLGFEFEKLNIFFELKLLNFQQTCRSFRLNCQILKTQIQHKKYQIWRAQLKEQFHKFYKELILMQQFVKVNQESFRKIIKKYNKNQKYLDEPKKINENEYFQNSQIQKNEGTFSLLIKEFEAIYLITFYKQQDAIKQGNQQLRKISHNKIITQKETFYFGLFIGISILLIAIIILLLYEHNLDVDHNTKFKQFFPMFRGQLLFIMYIFMIGLNVYGWQITNINYKLIFKFNYHFSDASSIFKRSALLFTIFMILILLYIIVEQKIGKLGNLLIGYPYEYSPLVIWIIIIFYFFFPSKKHFNYQGRVYLLKMLVIIFSTPLHIVDFRVSWATGILIIFLILIILKDQLILNTQSAFIIINSNNKEIMSLVQLKTDLILQQQQRKFSNQKFQMFTNRSVPLILRILQCFRQMYDKKFKKDLIISEFLNTIKYFLSEISVIFAFQQKKYQNISNFYFYLWCIFAFVSTCYSYIWDLKMDWGFLQFNSKIKFLRNELSYPKHYYYYVAILINLVLRFAWVVTLSPQILQRTLRPQFYILISALIEQLRRCIWNFFRVEKEHVQNVGKFRAVQDIVMPFPEVHQNEDDEELDKLFQIEMLNYNRKLIFTSTTNMGLSNQLEIFQKIIKNFSNENLINSAKMQDQGKINIKNMEEDQQFKMSPIPKVQSIQNEKLKTYLIKNNNHNVKQIKFSNDFIIEILKQSLIEVKEKYQINQSKKDIQKEITLVKKQLENNLQKKFWIIESLNYSF